MSSKKARVSACVCFCNNLQTVSYSPYNMDHMIWFISDRSYCKDYMLNITFNLQWKVMIGMVALNWKTITSENIKTENSSQ